MSNRAGFSLTEVIIGLVVTSIVSASIVQVITVQSRFMATQEGRSNARAVARGATGLMLSDLRMVQTRGGVVIATADSIVVRVPYAMGLICGHSGGNTDIMIQPVDSMTKAQGNANAAGYGWIDSNGTVSYVENGNITLNGGVSSTCTTNPNPITVLPGAELHRVQGGIPGGFRGAPVFLSQRISYAFRPSTSVIGRRGLFRTRVAANDSEELVAPFDGAARFRFFEANDPDANDAPPADLNDLRGIELNLVGVNERAAVAAEAEIAPLRTAVFFNN
jgi:prepilin-type N-terminal cleavage/methylation domain-containing protein